MEEVEMIKPRVSQAASRWNLSFDDATAADDPLYARYEQLHYDFTALEADSEEYSMFASTENRMLLWHGSRLSNWAGILSQGLRIAPPEAPVSVTYSARVFTLLICFQRVQTNCCASEASRSGVLVLCEVALGDMNELLDEDYNANNLPEGKLRSVTDTIISYNYSTVFSLNNLVCVFLVEVTPALAMYKCYLSVSGFSSVSESRLVCLFN
ncbi:Poly [ADP-ribose] polymerase 2 [Dichanthelium oligosanthes]|uniref:Poly [ADP-ribose] polymerase n=1 Tax=Dichanthelium oligosanthes TaxID=888268 RepID=A0A1E5W8G0_9POAL|nr:Poly [ADP-ribose] polymerase 2 [Dichanthelium oligosanthes]